VATLDEMKNLHLYDFGIFIELMPDEEEKQMLENNIQVSLQQGSIDLDDAIDLRNIRSVKLANQMLKVKRRKKQERDQAMQQQNIQAQAQANAQAQQVAAQAEVQKNQANIAATAQLEQTRNELKTKYLRSEVEAKKDLMAYEFELDAKLQMMKQQVNTQLEVARENRKDDRIDKQAVHQKQMIDKRTEGSSLKNFESSSNDTITGDANVS